MKWLRWIAVALGSAALGFVIAWTAGWLPIGQEPAFFTLDGVRRLNCCGAPDTTPRLPVTLEFLDQGHTAVLRQGQTETRLRFEHGSLGASAWSAGRVRLMLDPEIYIYGLESHQIGPCERI